MLAWREIHRRKISRERYDAEREHLAALSPTLVEKASGPELDDFEPLLQDLKPGRGQREGHPTTRLHEAVDRGRARKRTWAERVVELVETEMRARPPVGVEAAYVAGFFARRRGELVGVVAAA